MANSYFLAGAFKCCISPKSEVPNLLRHMLSESEKLCGACDKNHKIVGVGFDDNDAHIWYSGHCGNVAIRLSQLSKESQADQVYQLAHECVHLLAPCTCYAPSVLEEGVATVFAEDFTRTLFPSFERPQLASFREAAHHVRELLRENPGAIAALRSIEGVFYRMDASTFVIAGLDHVSHGLRETLLSRFVYV